MAKAKKYTARRSITLQVSGIEELLKQVQSVGGNVDHAVKTAIRESAEPVYRDIEAWAEKHKRTGVLLAGVDVSEPQQSGNEISVTVGINDEKSKGAWHGVYVEYGTPTQTADPGIRNAFDNNQAKVKRIQREVLKREGMPID